MAQLTRWIINLAVIYGIVVGVALLARRALIYPFDETAAWTGDLPGILIKEVARPDGSTLVVWAAEPELKKPVVYYFMGNAGHLEYFDPVLRELRLHGYGVVAMAYRGGGGADGQPSEAGLKADAKYIWDNTEAVLRIRPPAEQRFIYGTSLGTGIAVDLAAGQRLAGVILEAPFTRLCEVAQYQLKIVPACRLMWDEFYPVIDQVGDIAAPVLVLHGSDDRTIPVEMGEAVAAAAREATLKIFPGGDHNDLRLFGAGELTQTFIEAHTPEFEF